MNPILILDILAGIDAALTGADRAVALLGRLRAEGLITLEEQEERLNRVALSRQRVGMAPGSSSHSPGSGNLPPS